MNASDIGRTPADGNVPELDGAVGWLNSTPVQRVAAREGSLIRQKGQVEDRTFEIEFRDPDVQEGAISEKAQRNIPLIFELYETRGRVTLSQA